MERIEFWEEELRGSEVYDKRAKTSLSRICAAIEEKSGQSFSSACAGSLRQNGGRLFADAKTTSELLQHGHYEQTALRCSAKEVVVAQDTTELNYTSQKAKTGLGQIGSTGFCRGVLTHTALAVERDGLPLGIIGQKSWVRRDSEFGKKKRRNQTPIADKESHKWIDGLRWAERLSERATKVIVVGDREGDVYEFLSAPRRANVSLIVRAAQRRRVTTYRSANDPQQNAHEQVFSAMKSARTLGTRTIELEREKFSERVALVVRVCEAQVHRSGRFGAKSALPKTIPIWIVQAEESSATPVKNRERISWTLLCTERTETEAEAFRRLDDYTLRWRVERFHYTLKQGLKVEALQFDDAQTLMNAVAVYSLVAWRLMFITYYARLYPTHPSSAILASDEHRALSAKAKQSVDTVGHAVLEIAKLGGYRKSNSPPGLKVVWQGLYALQFLTDGFSLALSQKDTRQD